MRARSGPSSARVTSYSNAELPSPNAIVPEPVGGAHRNHQEIAATLKTALVEAFGELRRVPPDRLAELRYQKFRRMGVFEEV